MSELLRVWGCNHGRIKWACQYYRMSLPLECFETLGLAQTWDDNLEAGFESSAAAMVHSDFDLFWGVGGDEVLEQFRELWRLRPVLAPDGTWRIPPTLIFDTDDNRDYIHPHNSTFAAHGVRAYPDTKLLSPGSTLYAIDEETGEKKILWIDKETSDHGVTFDIARNIDYMYKTHAVMRRVDGVTVSTPHLAKYIRDVVGVKRVHTFPNTIVPEHYQSYPLMPHEGIRILWQGGSSHTIDWYPLRHAIREVALKYPQVKWVIFGHLDEWVEKYLPPEQMEHHKWIDYAAYKLKRGLMQIDINLCPLTDNLFNRCKSAIKWYEGSVWDKPEATLAANVPPFSDEMVNDETGLLYDDPVDFVQKLSALIENADLRHRLAHAARKWVLTHRVPSVTIPPLWNFYQECRNAKIGDALLSKGASTSEIKRLAAAQGLLR